MATVIGKVATLSRQMATLSLKVATVQAQMAIYAQILEVILIKSIIKCIERDGNNENSFIRDENVVEVVWIWYKNRQSL